jgi:hypothetical protein
MTASTESLIFSYHGKEDNSGQYLGKPRKKIARQGNDVITRARKIYTGGLEFTQQNCTEKSMTDSPLDGMDLLIDESLQVATNFLNDNFIKSLEAK